MAKMVRVTDISTLRPGDYIQVCDNGCGTLEAAREIYAGEIARIERGRTFYFTPCLVNLRTNYQYRPDLNLNLSDGWNVFRRVIDTIDGKRIAQKGLTKFLTKHDLVKGFTLNA